MFNGQGNGAGAFPLAMPDGLMAAELRTGNLTIDADHQQFYLILKAARSVCQDMTGPSDCSGCAQTCREHCESELLRLLGDLLSFVVEHFKTEESMMRDSLFMMVDHLACEAHMEDHAAISSRIERIISSLDTVHTQALLRDLDYLLGTWVTKHIATQDIALVSWIEREDSALKSGF